MTPVILIAKVCRLMDEFDPYHKWLGIPPEEQPPHLYRLLGIGLFEQDPDVIDNAAQRQMAHVRTFQAGKHAVASQKLLNELATARVCLLNRSTKAEYDTALHAALIATHAATTPLATPPLVPHIVVPDVPTAVRVPPTVHPVGPSAPLTPSSPQVFSQGLPISSTTRRLRRKSQSSALSVMLFLAALFLAVVLVIVLVRLMQTPRTSSQTSYDFHSLVCSAANAQRLMGTTQLFTVTTF